MWSLVYWKNFFSFLTYFAWKLWHQDAWRWFLCWDDLWMRIKEDFRRELLKMEKGRVAISLYLLPLLSCFDASGRQMHLKSGNELSGALSPSGTAAVAFSPFGVWAAPPIQAGSNTQAGAAHTERVSGGQTSTEHPQHTQAHTSAHRYQGFPSVPNKSNSWCFLLVWSHFWAKSSTINYKCVRTHDEFIQNRLLLTSWLTHLTLVTSPSSRLSGTARNRCFTALKRHGHFINATICPTLDTRGLWGWREPSAASAS